MGTETIYLWRVKTKLPERFGQRCKVLARGKMNSCLVQFEDGFKVLTSRNYVRREKRLGRKYVATDVRESQIKLATRRLETVQVELFTEL